jgi:hypothetical protein
MYCSCCLPFFFCSPNIWFVVFFLTLLCDEDATAELVVFVLMLALALLLVLLAFSEVVALLLWLALVEVVDAVVLYC